MHTENKVCTKFQQRTKPGRPCVTMTAQRPTHWSSKTTTLLQVWLNLRNMQRLEDLCIISNISINFKPLTPMYPPKVPLQQHWLAGTDILGFRKPPDPYITQRNNLTQCTKHKSIDEATQPLTA